MLTDRQDCFSTLVKQYDVKLIQVPPKPSLIEIKAMKPNLLSFLPSSVNASIYLDADILVMKPLGPFLQSIRAEVGLQARSNNFDFAMFPDAKGHYVGFCSGCEKWHTGVVVLRRGKASNGCMREWETQLLSGRYSTDQESIDAAERQGACPSPVSLSSRHLLFARDYIAAALSGGHSFVHATGIERMQEQDFFYR